MTTGLCSGVLLFCSQWWNTRTEAAPGWWPDGSSLAQLAAHTQPGGVKLGENTNPRSGQFSPQVARYLDKAAIARWGAGSETELHHTDVSETISPVQLSEAAGRNGANNQRCLKGPRRSIWRIGDISTEWHNRFDVWCLYAALSRPAAWYNCEQGQERSPESSNFPHFIWWSSW